MPLPRAECRHHAGRPAIGVCTGCRSAMCEECSTRVDGILRCRACVTAGTTEVRPRRVAWRSARAVLPALVLAPLAWGAVGWGLYGLARAVAAAAAAVEQAEEFLFEMAEF